MIVEKSLTENYNWIKREIRELGGLIHEVNLRPLFHGLILNEIDITIDGQYFFESLRHLNLLDSFRAENLVLFLRSNFANIRAIHLVVHQISPAQKEEFQVHGVQVHTVRKVKNVDAYVQDLATKLVFVYDSKAIAYLTGDDDFIYSVATFQRNAKLNTYVLGFEHNTGKKLKQTCSQFIPLDSYFIHPKIRSDIHPATIADPEHNESALKALFNPNTSLAEVDLANSLFGDS